MSDKRKLERIPLIYYLVVIDRNTTKKVGYLVDITTEGAMILTENPVEKDRVMQLAVEVPKEDFSGKNIEFDAVCVRSIFDSELGFYDSGFTFLKISQECIDEISTLIEKFGTEDLDDIFDTL